MTDCKHAIRRTRTRSTSWQAASSRKSRARWVFWKVLIMFFYRFLAVPLTADTLGETWLSAFIKTLKGSRKITPGTLAQEAPRPRSPISFGLKIRLSTAATTSLHLKWEQIYFVRSRNSKNSGILVGEIIGQRLLQGTRLVIMWSCHRFESHQELGFFSFSLSFSVASPEKVSLGGAAHLILP